jgi:hypothetical protein
MHWLIDTDVLIDVSLNNQTAITCINRARILVVTKGIHKATEIGEWSLDLA